jgi:hypothetical protein
VSVRVSSWVIACLPVLLSILCAPTAADELNLTRRHDPWGRFQPGAWKHVRATTESFGDDEPSESVTETKTVLAQIGETSVTLDVEVGTMLGGKRFEPPVQTVERGFHGDVGTAQPKIQDLGEEVLTIENRLVPCHVYRLEFARPAGRKVTKLYFSDTVEPYIIKRETALYDDGTTAPTSETTVEIVALEAPCRLLNNFRKAARVKSVHKNASGTTTTLAWTSSLVPGGLICCESQQVDPQGRIVVRTNLEMLDYGLQESQQRGGLFWRRRQSRARMSIEPANSP